MTKHTEEPWETAGPNIIDGNIYIRLNSDEEMVADEPIATMNLEDHDPVDQKARARLMAAAPELLLALELLVKTCPFKAVKGGITAEISMEKIQVAQAALKKANVEA